MVTDVTATRTCMTQVPVVASVTHVTVQPSIMQSICICLLFLSLFSALSKAALGLPANLSVVRLVLPFKDTDVAYEFCILPVKVPSDGSYDTQNRGTMYFVSPQVNTWDSPEVTTVALYAITNTATLNSTSPSLFLSRALVTTPKYYSPRSDGAAQKIGSIPLGSSLGATKVHRLSASDGRLISAVWARGRVWFSGAGGYSQNLQYTSAIVGALIPAWQSSGAFGARLFLFRQFVVEGQHLLLPAVSINRWSGLQPNSVEPSPIALSFPGCQH